MKKLASFVNNTKRTCAHLWFRPIKTTELSMEETHHHFLQFVYGRNLWTQGRDSCHLTKNEVFYSVQPACDTNANSNVKLLDQHHKLIEQN